MNKTKTKLYTKALYYTPEVREIPKLDFESA